jgi:perosamine synthetase
MALLRGQGMDPERRYWFPVVGYNYRMTNLCAAIGLAQLERIEAHLESRRRVAAWYARHLAPLRGRIVLPAEADRGRHAYWMYTVVLDPAETAESRDRVMARLLTEGIETRPVFYPMHTMPPYYEGGKVFPVAERISRGGINLPTHGLLTEEDVAFIASRLAAALGG